MTPGAAQRQEGEMEPSMFDAPEWQERIAKSVAEIEVGEGTVYLSDEEFLASLDVPEEAPR